MQAGWQLRAAFARQLSLMYGAEVPAYPTLVQVAGQVNAEVLARDGADAERLGAIDRVTAERHAAIRVGTVGELTQARRLFAAFGMAPVGFYDLREPGGAGVPVVSTAFRPVTASELARNPFRVFTSVLVTDDRRYFDGDLQARLENRLAHRQLFGDELLSLADRTAAEGGLPGSDADRLVALATAAFRLSTEPVDHAWYDELAAVSPVAADIGGVPTTHINHLTPRVLDIDELYRRMEEHGIEMIDAIQGPPRWSGPEVLLRQTSFRALAEPRRFREPDGSVNTGSLRVRFGEVEARGIALTPTGRDRYDTLIAEIDAAVSDGADRDEVAPAIWARGLPHREAELESTGLGYFTYRVAAPASRARIRAREAGPTRLLAELVSHGSVLAEPIVYEDFLPRSAAGIFASNLERPASVQESAPDADGGPVRDLAWLSGAIGADVHDPMQLYAAHRRASLDEVAIALGRDPAGLVPPPGTTNRDTTTRENP